MLMISTNFEVDMAIHYLAAGTLWDLCPWPFDLGHLSYMVAHVVNPSPNFKTYAYLFFSCELWPLS